jgi:hypothetical protein
MGTVWLSWPSDLIYPPPISTPPHQHRRHYLPFLLAPPERFYRTTHRRVPRRRRLLRRLTAGEWTPESPIAPVAHLLHRVAIVAARHRARVHAAPNSTFHQLGLSSTAVVYRMIYRCILRSVRLRKNLRMRFVVIPRISLIPRSPSDGKLILLQKTLCAFIT